MTEERRWNVGTTVADVISESFDPGDDFASTMESLFGITFALYFRDLDVPATWGFRPGMASEDSMEDECPIAFDLLWLLDRGDIQPYDLQEFGAMLHDRVGIMDALSLTY